jgi:ATP-dependent helicase HrpA
LITPVAGVNVINAQRCEWLIPGMLHEKVVAIIKSLPKQLRKNFVPAPNFADACVQALEPSDIALCTAVANHLKKMTGVQIPYDAWDMQKVDQHLLMNFRVLGVDGCVIEEGRELQAIKNKLSGSDNEASVFDSAAVVDAEENTDQTFNLDDVAPDVLDDMAETVEINLQGVKIKAYPALVRDGRQVNLRALESKRVASYETAQALRQLVINALPEQVKNLKKSIPDIQNLCLKYTDFGRCDDLKLDIINKTIDDVFLYGDIRSEAEFRSRLEKGRGELHEQAKQWSDLLTNILDEYRLIKKIMKQPAFSQLDTVSDIHQQLNYLFPNNFITTIDREWLQQYPRYLLAINKRFDKSKTNATRDRQSRLMFSKLWDEYIKRQQSLAKQHVESEELVHYRWMLEEYRVSLYAQELKTKFPVSEKRLRTFWNELSV